MRPGLGFKASLSLAALALGAGCAQSQANFPMGGQLAVTEAPVPKQERCTRYKSEKQTFSQCQEFKEQALNYIRSLNARDDICVDGGFGEEPGPACKARGSIIDADSRGFLVQIRSPAMDSKWKDYNQRRVYFRNEALVDLYLIEKGYE